MILFTILTLQNFNHSITSESFSVVVIVVITGCGSVGYLTCGFLAVILVVISMYFEDCMNINDKQAP